MTMTYKLTIPGNLPSLNQYIEASRANIHKAANMKKETEVYLILHIRDQFKGVKIKTPVTMGYTWYEKNRKRDIDNVSSFGRKVIQDALVRAGVLAGDGWAYIQGYTDAFEIDKNNPRIEVLIQEER